MIFSIDLKMISFSFRSWVYLVLGSIDAIAFALFVSSIIKSPLSLLFPLTPSVIAVSVNIVLNCIGYFCYSSESLWLHLLPLTNMTIICMRMLTPAVFGVAAYRAAVIASVVMFIVYVALGYVIWCLRIDIGTLLDSFYQKKHVKNGYREMDDSTLITDDDVAKEEATINDSFAEYTPDHRDRRSLVVDGVSKYFFTKEGHKRVFPPISFAVNDYEVYGLLGPNGAGKTTLINILTGKMNPNRGEFKVFGNSSKNRRAMRRFISVVPQFDTFFDELSVSEIAEQLGISSNYLSKLFKEETGTGFAVYLTDYRIERSIALMKEHTLPLSQIAERCGFRQYTYFTNVFKKKTGKSPRAYLSEV